MNQQPYAIVHSSGDHVQVVLLAPTRADASQQMMELVTQLSAIPTDVLHTSPNVIRSAYDFDVFREDDRIVLWDPEEIEPTQMVQILAIPLERQRYAFVYRRGTLIANISFSDDMDTTKHLVDIASRVTGIPDVHLGVAPYRVEHPHDCSINHEQDFIAVSDPDGRAPTQSVQLLVGNARLDAYAPYGVYGR